MRALNLPTYSFKIKSQEGKNYIFDRLRKKFVVLTPEEWVRQHFASFLIDDRNYPAGRIVIEKSLKFNQLAKRCDILIYDGNRQPLVLVECKAPGVNINASVFDQIAVYNLNFRVKYLMVTNGLKHYCVSVDFESHQTRFLREIPFYSEIAVVPE